MIAFVCKSLTKQLQIHCCANKCNAKVAIAFDSKLAPWCTEPSTTYSCPITVGGIG